MARKLTPARFKFAKNVASGLFKSNTECARDAGLKHPKEQAVRLMKDHLVLQEIERQRKMRERAEQKREDAQAEQIGRREGIKRSEILDLLAGIARNETFAPLARVRALGELASVTGMKITRTIQDREFEGRTEKELEYFVDHGHWPEQSAQVEHLEPERSSPPGAAGEGQKTSKPN